MTRCPICDKKIKEEKLDKLTDKLYNLIERWFVEVMGEEKILEDDEVVAEILKCFGDTDG